MEILTYKIKFKMLKDKEFEFKFEFNAPSENSKLDVGNYLNTKAKNRFQETSFAYIAKTNSCDQGYDITHKLSNSKDENNNKWIKCEFKKLACVVDEIIELEISISHRFDYKDDKEIANYFKDTYSKAHAVREFCFQIEKYNTISEKFKHFVPILLNANDERILHKFNEGVYYKTYNWKIYYDKDKTKVIQLKTNHE